MADSNDLSTEQEHAAAGFPEREAKRLESIAKLAKLAEAERLEALSHPSAPLHKSVACSVTGKVIEDLAKENGFKLVMQRPKFNNGGKPDLLLAWS